MKTRPLKSFCLAAGLIILPCFPSINAAEIIPAPARPFDWGQIDINDKQYIPLEKLKVFYKGDKLSIREKKIILEGRQWKAEFEVSSHLIFFNHVKYYLSEPIRIKDQKPYISQLDLTSLIDPILRPRARANANVKPFKTVIIDAGHGGKDKGAAGLEAEETLKLALLLRDMLQKQGLTVILTRDNNDWLPLGERVNIANAHDNAIMLSLHYNSGPKRAHGFETYIMSARAQFRDKAAASNNGLSVALATAVHSRCLLYLNNPKYGNNFEIEDRGIRRARFNVLSNCQHPSILIEAGFLTHKEEATKIGTEAYRKTLASAITRGITVYQSSLKKMVQKKPLLQLGN